MGFFSSDVVPSPKLHKYVGAGAPVEVFVNVTVKGAEPESSSTVNDASGAFAVAVTYMVSVEEPNWFVAVRVTLNVPP